MRLVVYLCFLGLALLHVGSRRNTIRLTPPLASVSRVLKMLRRSVGIKRGLGCDGGRLLRPPSKDSSACQGSLVAPAGAKLKRSQCTALVARPSITSTTASSSSTLVRGPTLRQDSWSHPLPVIPLKRKHDQLQPQARLKNRAGDRQRLRQESAHQARRMGTSFLEVNTVRAPTAKQYMTIVDQFLNWSGITSLRGILPKDLDEILVESFEEGYFAGQGAETADRTSAAITYIGAAPRPPGAASQKASAKKAPRSRTARA